MIEVDKLDKEAGSEGSYHHVSDHFSAVIPETMQDTYDPTEINIPVDSFFDDGDELTMRKTTPDYEKLTDTYTAIDDGYNDDNKLVATTPVVFVDNKDDEIYDVTF